MYVCMYDVLEHCYKLVLNIRCTTTSTTVPAAAILVKSVNNLVKHLKKEKRL